MWLDVLESFSGKYDVQLSGSQISRHINMPQRTVSRKLDFLEKLNVLVYEHIGKNKTFSLNFTNPRTKYALRIVENNKALKFSQKHKKIFVTLSKVSNNHTVVLFGSYARGNQTSKSDVDILVLGKKSKQVIDITSKALIKINPHFSTEIAFKKLLVEKNALALEIIKEHVIFGDISRFFNVCWSYYYE